MGHPCSVHPAGKSKVTDLSISIAISLAHCVLYSPHKYLLTLLGTASAPSSHTRDTPIPHSWQPWIPGSLPGDHSSPHRGRRTFFTSISGLKAPFPIATLLLCGHFQCNTFSLIIPPTMGSVPLSAVSDTRKRAHVAWIK